MSLILLTNWIANSESPYHTGAYPLGDRPSSNKSHGDVVAVVVAESGTKTDNNFGGYSFQGSIHTNLRATDFDNATEQYDATNTQSSWAAALDGYYPALSGNFNNDAVTAKSYVQLTGGPTVSGKYLRRQADAAAKAQASFRLRNFMQYVNDGSFHPVFYRSALIWMPTSDSGKYTRDFFETDASAPGDLQNHYLSKSGGDNIATWNLEFSENVNPSSGFSDNPSSFSSWQRVESLLDFENDQYWQKINGELLVDASRGFSGVISGFMNGTVNSRVLSYSEMGNTLDQENTDAAENPTFVGWANPYADFSAKRIEICASSTYDGALAVPQPIKSWTDDNVEFIVNRGHLTTEQLASSYVFYINNLTATSLGALNG